MEGAAEQWGMSALLDLKRYDSTPNGNQFFHGLLRQKRMAKDASLNGFVSTTLNHRLIESSFHDQKEGALLLLYRGDGVIYADIEDEQSPHGTRGVVCTVCYILLDAEMESNGDSDCISETGNSDEIMMTIDGDDECAS